MFNTKHISKCVGLGMLLGRLRKNGKMNPVPRSLNRDIDVLLEPLIKRTSKNYERSLDERRCLRESPDNVETSFPAWFNYKIREKKVTDGCSEELFSLARGPISACTYPACIVNGVKFVVHERDILHTTQCSGVSTLGLDGEMYYGQLEEILELTYIGHRKVVLFRCKWFDTINPKNHTTRNRRSYIDQGIHHILTDREFHRNNQYILATQVTQVFYLQDLARQPRGWKVVEHVYHRDVAESDQDVIHGSSSSHVTLSVGLTNLEHTDLSINAQSTEVDAPPVNDDNANANEDNADFINNEDDVVAHVLDDDDVVVSDDDEVNPSTNVEEMACLAPRSHGGDAADGPTGPYRPSAKVRNCSSLRIETGNASLRKAFRHNNQQPLTLGFDVDDLGTFHPIGDYASMLNSLMGETIRPLPLACECVEKHEEMLLNTASKNSKVEKRHHEDLIQTWKKTHSNSKTGQFKYEENKQRYLKMKAMQDQIRAGVIPYKTDQEILDEVVPSDNRQNMSGMGRKLPGGGSTS
ncbi:Myc-type, basic helix-loop-helix domain-containing protein, partial [Tanacetum coccineum]